jgi:glycosyltransferase involved in cell wall biosynthesis
MIRYQKKYNKYFVEYFRQSIKYQNRTVPQKEVSYRKISIVTTCMDRLHDLKITLPQNIKDSGDYPVEFILLDYGSSDGLEQWVLDKMLNHIKSGKLIYYKTLNQKFFKPNHSRNVSFRLATSDIITNVDSDNYIHSGFLENLNKCCNYKTIAVSESFISPNSNTLNLKGRFALMKKDLYKLGGFDEDLDEGYGHDDTAFIFRALLSNFKLCRFDDCFLKERIETKMKDRSKNMINKDYSLSQEKNIKNITDKLFSANLIANKNRGWGEATVIKNFLHSITLKGIPSIQ